MTSTTLIAHVAGDALERATSWADLPPDERRRRAVAACTSHDTDALWQIADAYLTLHGRAGATVSAYTRRNYHQGVTALLGAWTREDLLHPRHDAAAVWLRHLEVAGRRAARRTHGTPRGLAPATITVHLAAARTLYKALRWTRATDAEPFTDVRPAPDQTAPWDRRGPYGDDEVEELRRQAAPIDQVLVLLAGHGGLRVGEIVALRWEDMSLPTRDVIVRAGKGGKQRRVTLSKSTVDALETLRMIAPVENAADYMLPYRTTHEARARMRRLCARAGVPYKGIHSLRHTAGTRLFRETESMEDTARHLGHASTDTTRVYAKWSNTRLHATVGQW